MLELKNKILVYLFITIEVLKINFKIKINIQPLFFFLSNYKLNVQNPI